MSGILGTLLDKLGEWIFGKRDLKPTTNDLLRGLAWNTNLGADVSTVRQHVVDKARAAIGWYYAAKRGKKWAAWVFRGGIILLTSAAGILPLANEVQQSRQTDQALHEVWQWQMDHRSAAPDAANTQPPLPKPSGRLFAPAWSAILLALAGTLLALDRFHGATSGWVRYLRAAQELTTELDDFELEFERLRAGWDQGTPSRDEARAALALAQRFMRDANAIVRKETDAWAEEFAGAVKDMELQLKTMSAAKERGWLRVTVTNGDQCADGWKLEVGDLPATKRQGKVAEETVAPGKYSVRASGEIAGKPVKAGKQIAVAAGATELVELTLV